jgi:hypothetical protein
MPVQITVPADEASIAKAVQEGTGVNPKSAFGQQIEVIAHKMAGKAPNGQSSGSARPRKQFIEFFSIPQAKGLDPSRL